MTFTPQVLTQTDNNNSASSLTSASFNGISTITTGYNTLILTFDIIILKIFKYNILNNLLYIIYELRFRY
jgi:hypothetical protein